jgi:starvation-inducible outer membrane lipoprotein
MVDQRSVKMKKTLLVLALSAVVGCAHPEPTRYQIFGIKRFRQIKNNPKRHVGKLYAFGGRVINAEEAQNRTTFEILVQDDVPISGRRVTTGGSLLVAYPGGGTTVADGHQVKVLGYIRGPEVGRNVFGATVSSVKLDAIAVYDSFTQYPFWLTREQDLFEKWKTGEPLSTVLSIQQ